MNESKVSFTQIVKEEICSSSFETEHLRSILASFIKINGSVVFSNKKSSLVIKTENAKVAKFIYSCIQNVYGLNARFSFSKMMNFKKRTTYSVILDNETDYILGDLEINFLEGKIAKNIISNDNMIAGYLCGAFLASGSVNSPKNSNYHLEISLNDENYAKWFTKLFTKYKSGQFNAKIVKRRNEYVTYLKRSDQISDFLILIGATNAALEFEETRIERDFSNIGNRLANLDAANYSKTSLAASRQIEEIKIIDKFLGIENISNKKQRILMKLRLENEDASLQELANLLSEEIGDNVSRSNVAHIFRSIHNRANKYIGAIHDK